MDGACGRPCVKDGLPDHISRREVRRGGDLGAVSQWGGGGETDERRSEEKKQAWQGRASQRKVRWVRYGTNEALTNPMPSSEKIKGTLANHAWIFFSCGWTTNSSIVRLSPLPREGVDITQRVPFDAKRTKSLLYLLYVTFRYLTYLAYLTWQIYIFRVRFRLLPLLYVPCLLRT